MRFYDIKLWVISTRLAPHSLGVPESKGQAPQEGQPRAFRRTTLDTEKDALDTVSGFVAQPRYKWRYADS